jgi:hypothetical protein
MVKICDKSSQVRSVIDFGVVKLTVHHMLNGLGIIF